MFYLDENKYKNECGKCCSKCMDRQTHLCKKSCFYLTFRCDDLIKEIDKFYKIQDI